MQFMGVKLSSLGGRNCTVCGYKTMQFRGSEQLPFVKEAPLNNHVHF